MNGTFASKLLSRHFQDEGVEVCARQFLADVLQPVREVFADALLSAFLSLEMEREGAEDRLPIGHLRRLPRKEHLASRGHGGVARAPRQKDRSVLRLCCFARWLSDAIK